MLKQKYLHNSTVGELLKNEFLIPSNLSQEELAQAILVPPNRISQIIRNKREITADTDQRLCKFFCLTPGFFLNLQADWKLREADLKLKKELDKIVPLSQLNRS